MKKKKTSKRQAILKEKTQIQMLYCESTEIPITEDFETLGMTVDDKLKFKKHFAKVCRKVWYPC